MREIFFFLTGPETLVEIWTMAPRTLEKWPLSLLNIFVKNPNQISQSFKNRRQISIYVLTGFTRGELRLFNSRPRALSQGFTVV